LKKTCRMGGEKKRNYVERTERSRDLAEGGIKQEREKPGGISPISSMRKEGMVVKRKGDRRCSEKGRANESGRIQRGPTYGIWGEKQN